MLNLSYYYDLITPCHLITTTSPSQYVHRNRSKKHGRVGKVCGSEEHGPAGGLGD